MRQLECNGPLTRMKLSLPATLLALSIPVLSGPAQACKGDGVGLVGGMNQLLTAVVLASPIDARVLRRRYALEKDTLVEIPDRQRTYPIRSPQGRILLRAWNARKTDTDELVLVVDRGAQEIVDAVEATPKAVVARAERYAEQRRE